METLCGHRSDSNLRRRVLVLSHVSIVSVVLALGVVPINPDTRRVMNSLG